MNNLQSRNKYLEAYPYFLTKTNTGREAQTFIFSWEPCYTNTYTISQWPSYERCQTFYANTSFFASEFKYLVRDGKVSSVGFFSLHVLKCYFVDLLLINTYCNRDVITNQLSLSDLQCIFFILTTINNSWQMLTNKTLKIQGFKRMSLWTFILIHLRCYTYLPT